jgi:hypothetical protein
LFSLRRDEQYAYTRPFKVEGTIEVHYPVFRPLLGRGHLDRCPLRHKVCKDLRLDPLLGAKLNFELSKINRPFDNAAVGVAVADDLPLGE